MVYYHSIYPSLKVYAIIKQISAKQQCHIPSPILLKDTIFDVFWEIPTRHFADFRDIITLARLSKQERQFRTNP